MEVQYRPGIAVGLDRDSLDETVIAFLELNAFGLRNAMNEVRPVARGQVQLQPAFVVADTSQRLFVDLMLSAEVFVEKLESGTRS
ncbi:MAG: hypothetical protein DMF59_08075 [Acidobacteria bacterium]|nr:MAG: hypothetical protein DMF59_08075 [Acidobacteriota bacterium]